MTADPAEAEELYERAPCALFSSLLDGTIVRANQTFFAWLGAAPDAIIGKVRFQQILAFGSRIYYETHYAPLLQMQGFISEIALDVRREDGTLSPVVASARHVYDDAGRPALVRVALFDATDRRRYEQEILQARKRAERAASDLERANNQKNEFIATLAHELRNPLAPIIDALSVLARHAVPDAAKQQATAVLRRQVGQMSRLVEDLMDISRVGQNKLSLRMVPLDVTAVVQQAFEASAPLLARAGLRYRAALPDVPVFVEGDAARLAQVVVNVLNNAGKFTPRGGTVTLAVGRDGDFATIAVRDTGIGMSPAQLSSVFGMFMQATSSSESRSGLGIGLTLSKTLVERHGGTISVASEGLGKGTQVLIRLPAMAVVQAPAESTPFVAEPRLPSTDCKRVLVIDDNADSAEMVAVLLTHAGHVVHTARDGEEGLEVALAFDPDVVLLDITLPGMSGYEAAARFRSRQGERPVLVALTGWGQDEDRQRSAEAGFDHHVVKPVAHEALLALIAGSRRAAAVAPGDG